MLSLVWLSDPGVQVWQIQEHEVLQTMPDPKCVGLVNHARSKRFRSRNHARHKVLGYDKYVWFDKQQTKKIIVHFSCKEREKKKKTQIINHCTTIQQLSIYTHHTMWKRARLRIQLDGKWQDLATGKRHTCLFNGAGTTHSLECEEH